MFRQLDLFRNFVFTSYLELKALDKVHKPGDYEDQVLQDNCHERRVKRTV
jgi:hypothetical protein